MTCEPGTHDWQPTNTEKVMQGLVISTYIEWQRREVKGTWLICAKCKRRGFNKLHRKLIWIIPEQADIACA